MFLPRTAVQLTTDPLLSLRHPRVFGLYVVYALLHPLRENGCAQVFWNVISNSASDLVSFASTRAPLFHLFHSCHQYACVWSLALFGHSRLRQMYDIHLTNLTKACFSLSPYRERPHFGIHGKGMVWRLAVPSSGIMGPPIRSVHRSSQRVKFDRRGWIQLSWNSGGNE